MNALDLINDIAQKMTNKPSDGAMVAARNIAKKLDYASGNGNINRIEWSCWPIENSKTVDVVDVGNSDIVCRIYDRNMWEEIVGIFEKAFEQIDGCLIISFADLVKSVTEVIYH